MSSAPRAQLTLIEYGDFGCPFCFAASRPVGSLLERYPSLSLVWRHFPTRKLHPGADLAAELSELAAAHGTFREAHSLLLAGRELFTVDDLLSVAHRLDLDPAEAESALATAPIATASSRTSPAARGPESATLTSFSVAGGWRSTGASSHSSFRRC